MTPCPGSWGLERVGYRDRDRHDRHDRDLTFTCSLGLGGYLPYLHPSNLLF